MSRAKRSLNNTVPVLEAVILIKQMGISNTIIECDSLTLVQILKNKNMDCQWDVKTFVHTILQISLKIPSIIFRYVNRRINFVAHFIAKNLYGES